MSRDTTAITAWWGAILSSMVLGWDVYKWRTSGPKIRFTVQPNMETINMPAIDGKTIISAVVVNNGTPTTITNLGFLYYPGLIARIRCKPKKAFVIPSPSPAQQIPFFLAQGVVWQGMTIQSEEIEEMAREGWLYCVLYCSHCNKPFMRRVLIPAKFGPGVEVLHKTNQQG